MAKAIIDRNWCLCGKCRHKLFKIVKGGGIVVIEEAQIEIKCHSCKELNDIVFGTTMERPLD